MPIVSREEIQRAYPTPLAQLFRDACDPPGDPLTHLVWAFGECLRFVALLALHDSLVHRLYGRDVGRPAEDLARLGRPLTLGGWRALLRAACPADAGDRQDRAIRELSGWETGSASALDPLLETRNEWAHGKPPPQFQAHQTRERLLEDLQALYGLLAFLTDRVLIEVQEAPSRRQRSMQARLLRGVHPDPELLRLEVAGGERSPEEGDLYVLDPGSRTGLALWPAFMGVERQVCGLTEIDTKGGEPRRMLYQSFTSEACWYVADEKWMQRRGAAAPSDGRAQRYAEYDLRAELAQWLGAEWLKAAFDVDREATAASPGPQELPLADDSWEELLRIVRPPETLSMIGGRYRITGERLHAGAHADVYPAEEEGREAAGELAVHVLRAEAAEDAAACEWFARRAACWRRLSRDPAPRGLLALHERSDPHSTSPRPFVVVDRIGAGHTLADEVRHGGDLPEERRREVLQLAGELCVAAHRKGLRLVALPLHHFLVHETGRLHLTGLDAALEAREAETLRPDEDYWRRFVGGWTDIAPEARRGEELAPTVDVFALGVLAERLRPARGREPDPGGGAPPRDAWACLEYHCLASDPHLRFQTAAQFLLFLDEWVGGDAERVPPTVPVPPGRVRIGRGDGTSATEVAAFRITKYPITNAHFERFCFETNRSAPPAIYPERLRGPWCPVVGVSLPEAQHYCEWLSRSTGRSWRLPSEAEWMRAALGEAPHAGPYPWGEALKPGCANYGPDFGGPTVVGAFPPGQSPTGCLDVAGNVWEWCTDHMAAGEPRRVLKGGAHDFPAAAMSVTERRGVLVTHRSPHVGFRAVCEEA